MTPLRLSHTWHRRLYVAIFLLSASLVAIFALDYLHVFTVPESLKVEPISALLATFGVLLSIAFFTLEKKLTGFAFTFITYALFAAAVGWQVIQTGGVTSPYLILWTLVTFFAALFGAYGWLGVIVLVGSYVAGLYLGGDLSFGSLAIVILGSIIPLLIGIFVWREQGEIDDSVKNVKNLATQLSEVASQSEIVINAIGDGVMAIDSQGIIQLINPAGQEILGWGKQDALMLSYKSILKLEDENGKELDPAVEPLQQVLNTNQQARANNLLATTQSGKKISVSLVVNPIGDTGSGAIVVFRDITKERSEEREQAEFISTASHEMRTPVASIEGYLGLALNPNTATVDARAKDFIVKAQGAAQHLGRLFQDLLDVSKTDDGRMSNVPKVANVVELTETIVQGLLKKAEDKALRLTFIPSSGAHKKIMPVYYVNQDNDHIREILDNLIENAIKYTLAGEVVVDVNGTEDKVIISIKDSGLGIPAEDIPHLFQKFYRVSNMDRQEIGGTGLGLYLVRRLAEDIQGRVWVESVFGKGSTFFVELPRVETQEAEQLQAAQRAQLAQQPIQPAGIVTPSVPPVIPAPQSSSPSPTPNTTVSSPIPAPAPNTIPIQTQTTSEAQNVRPATTVPRGQTLTRDQINERVKQLEELAKKQRESTGR